MLTRCGGSHRFTVAVQDSVVQLLRGLLDVPVFVPVAPHDGGLPIGGAWYSLSRHTNVAFLQCVAARSTPSGVVG
jgi:hypothetical protein